MLQLGTGEVLVLPVILIIYAIPIVAAVWIIRTLRIVRSDVKTIQEELGEIRRLLMNKN
jgi:hypothetical protein